MLTKRRQLISKHASNNALNDLQMHVVSKKLQKSLRMLMSHKILCGALQNVSVCTVVLSFHLPTWCKRKTRALTNATPKIPRTVPKDP